MIRDRNIDPEGLLSALDLTHAAALGAPPAYGTANILTTVGTTTATGSITKAAATQPGAYRNLVYAASAATTAGFSDAGGTISVKGIDIYGSSVVETVARSAIEAATVQGSVLFKSISASGISLVGISMTATDGDSTKTANSMYIGQGSVLGLPTFVKNSSAIQYINLDGAVITAFTLTTHSFTNSGGVQRSQAGINIGAVASAKPLAVWYKLNDKVQER